MLDMHSILAALAAERPVFHSEADFQHALAWEIHRRHPNLNLRLEYRPPGAAARMYIDIWATTGDRTYAIELKYKTRRAVFELHGERFELLNHGAEDVNRYLFIKDLCRVEDVVATVQGFVGYAVLLTNVSGYWAVREPRSTIDSAFRIHEGRLLTGTLAWSAAAGPGTTRGVEAPLCLAGAYTAAWREYALAGDGPAAWFRYLLGEVGTPPSSS